MVGVAELRGQPPVDEHRLAELADQDVVGLEIAVEDAARVDVGDRVGHRQHVRHQRQPPGQPVGPRDDLVERLAADHPHRVERRAVVERAGVVDRHDRRVLEPAGQRDLADEARGGLGGAIQRDLDHDRAVEAAVVSGDDAAHAAAGQLGAELVAVERVRRGHRVGQPGRRWPGGAERQAGLGHQLETAPARVEVALDGAARSGGDPVFDQGEHRGFVEAVHVTVIRSTRCPSHPCRGY
jgi:hypothetical protein